MEIIEDKTKVGIAYVLKEMSGRILEEVPPAYPFVYIHAWKTSYITICGSSDIWWMWVSWKYVR